MSPSPTDRAARLFAVPAVRRVLNSHARCDGPLPSGELLRPHVTGRRYGQTHYNVVIPDLPAPHRYLACAVLIGRVGMHAFDIDHVVHGSPRNTATIALGTAATAPDWFSSYSIEDDCDLREDGSLMRFGQDLTIEGRFPDYHIEIERPGFALALDVTATEEITWFARSPIYDHIGFPARYRGILTFRDESTPVEGILSLEHARALTVPGLLNRTVPARLKFPWKFFTYHVIKVNPDTLLMLARADMFGQEVLTSAYHKEVGGRHHRWVHGVHFEVLSYRNRPQAAPDGDSTAIPHEFRWRITDGDRIVSEIIGTTDTDLIYGLGRGWIGGYTYHGHHLGEPVSGDAYYEYVDKR